MAIRVRLCECLIFAAGRSGSVTGVVASRSSLTDSKGLSSSNSALTSSYKSRNDDFVSSVSVHLVCNDKAGCISYTQQAHHEPCETTTADSYRY